VVLAAAQAVLPLPVLSRGAPAFPGCGLAPGLEARLSRLDGDGFVLGHIMSTLLLLVFFFLAVTPLGLLARWTGKDFLSVKLNRQAGSYWLRRRNTAPAKSSYEQQY
jgi:hypothetical protein